MSDKTRFSRRRALLRSRGLCIRCGREKAEAGHVKCRKCALEIGIKKIVAPARKMKCEKIGRLERNRALAVEFISAIDAELSALRG